MKSTNVITLSNKVRIGGDAPVSIQSMLTTPLPDIENCLAQLRALEDVGCEIVRAAVPDEDAAVSLLEVSKRTALPIVADIHFDHRLAILAAKNGAAKVRINPGNIGSINKVKEVVTVLKDLQIPIRIGVNGGSLEKDLLEKGSGPTAEGMVESAVRHIQILEDLDFHDTAVSLKSSSVLMTIEANRRFSARYPMYPLHIGVTEAGSGTEGIVNASMGIGSLLADGIGDTIRVSLTGDPVQEVHIAKAILSGLELRSEGVTIVSCPTCARCKVDLLHIVEEVKRSTRSIQKPLKLAIMGCAVNGPGEASHADLGIACSLENCVLFKAGTILRSVKSEYALDALLEEIATL